MKDQTVERHEVVVIGVGQAGLAAGYHLAQRRIEFVTLEASPRVGDVWRDRYDSLLLYSPARYDALPGHPFPLGRNVFPTGATAARSDRPWAGRQGAGTRDPCRHAGVGLLGHRSPVIASRFTGTKRACSSVAAS